jgi:protein phosphatase
MTLLEMFRSRRRSAGPAVPAEESTRPRFVLDVEMRTDVGCVRESNEDSVSIRHDHNAGSGDRALIVVADGMGGHNAGEVASATAVKIVEAAYPTMNQHPAESLKRALEEANAAIHRQASERPSMSGMGTTCTALLLQGEHAYAAHVGDSRLYLIRNGSIYLMTEDHSAVMELVKAGHIMLEEGRHHPDKNVVTRSLGGREQVEVSTWPQPLRVMSNDRFLVCSDGLYDQVEDHEMCETVRSQSTGDACQQLTNLARERGGPDNITIAIVAVRPVEETLPSQEPATREVEVSTR